MQQQIELPDTVAMPVRRYLHPESGGRVTFVGMVHAAQPLFFETVRELLDELQREGAGVYLEAPGHASPQELEEAEPQVREWALALRETLDGVIEWATSLGLVFQPEHLPAREDWEMPDASLLERAALLDEPTVRLVQRTAVTLSTMRSSVPLLEQKAAFVQNLAMVVKTLTNPALREMLAPGLMREVEALREARVIAALDERRALEPDCHVALVWGTEHLPAFDRALGDRGFKGEGEDRWLTAIDVVSFMADGSPES